MSSFWSLSRRRVCLNCIKNSIGEDGTRTSGLSWTQTRGKKKKVKGSDTINVRLLVDMKGYGRKGAFTPVAPGRMRNSWYPHQKAEYIATISDVDPRTVVAERDFAFGVQDLKGKKAPESSYDPVTLGPVPKAKTQLLTPQMATDILSELLPSRLVFHRTAIVEKETEKQSLGTSQPRSRRATSQAAQETYAASEPVPLDQAASSSPQLQTIFGSVSTADVADTVKALLAEDEDSRRVVIGPEDIKFVGEISNGVEGDRLKALGEFQLEIRVKGGEVALQRTVGVIAPER